MSYQERRRFPRYEAQELHGTFDNRVEFEALKISVGGLLIRLPLEPRLDDQARIALDLEGQVFESLAHVVFVGPDLGTLNGQFRVGLAFADPSPSAQLRLERFIHRHYE